MTRATSPTTLNPLPHQRHPRPPLEQDGPRRKYELSTSHALEGRSISVKSSDGRVVWSSTRKVQEGPDGEDEIVETLLDSLRHPRWTIHKPTTGWYLVLRSPSLPSTSFISLKPSPASSNPSILLFTIRSLLSFPSSSTPSPPSHAVPMLAFHEEVKQSQEPSKSHLRLQPHIPRHTHRLSSNAWSLSSFTGLFADRGKTFSCTWVDEGEAEVMRFEDAPSMLSTQTKGSLFLNEKLVDILGMEPSFWVAVACAHLGFLEDQEAYSAAQGG